jgi:hypothetical protein
MSIYECRNWIEKIQVIKKGITGVQTKEREREREGYKERERGKRYLKKGIYKI